MAERRMFAKTIIDSDIFLDMPLSSQALYFHLSMRADDEGFVNNPKKIQRMIGASEDDMRVLLAKNFILQFESGIIVIRHWKLHNYIRGDRLKNTVCEEEARQLTVTKNGVYNLTAKSDSQVTVECQSSDSQVSVSCPSSDGIGKVSIGKDSIGEDNKDKKAPSGRGGLPSIINFISSPSLREALTEYARMREKMKAPLTDYAMKLVIDQVEQMAKDEATRVAIINQSIKNGWKDLFPLETKPKKKNAVGAFGNYEQRNLDYSEVEKKIRGYK